MPRRNHTPPNRRQTPPAHPADDAPQTYQQMAAYLVEQGMASPAILGPIKHAVTDRTRP